MKPVVDIATQLVSTLECAGTRYQKLLYYKLGESDGTSKSKGVRFHKMLLFRSFCSHIAYCMPGLYTVTVFPRNGGPTLDRRQEAIDNSFCG